MKITKSQLKDIIKEELNEVLGFGNKAKRRRELEGFVEQYDVKGFLTQLMRAVTSGDRVPDELEGLADLTNQDSATQRQQLKTMIRQGGALQSFADSLPEDYDDAIGVIENIIQEDPQMFNDLMRDAAAKVGPMASPEQRLARSHR
jgi:predicted oxidoreductase (fatty acid repression mutant protein)